MKSLVRLTFRLATSALLLAAFPPLAEAAGPWKSSVQYTRHALAYSASVRLLGVLTPVSVVFGCDPVSDKESSGTLGFDITIKNVSLLKAFPFNDFEGPDVTTAPDVRVVVNRKGKPALSFRTTASGSYFEENAFCFSIADLSKKAESVPRSFLQALADNEAESVQISIADPRNPKSKLEFSIPVSGRQADFQTLLIGLK